MTERTVPRRTKIVATLGPATESEEAIDAVLKAGADVLRFNFSHGTAEEHIARAERVRRIGMQNNRHLAILTDLQGPKIRTEKFSRRFRRVKERHGFLPRHRLSSGRW